MPDAARAVGKPADLTTEELIMNVKGSIKDNLLTLVIDVSKDTLEKAAPSKSGKTKIIATTNGFTRFGDVGVSLNVTVPNQG